MAQIEAPTMRNQVANGTFGDANSAHAYADLSAAQIGDVVDLVRLPHGTRVDDVKLVHAAMGATTTLQLGYRYEDVANGAAVANYFLAAAASSSAGTRRSDKAPLEFTAPVILTATVAGAAATGRIDAVVGYVYRG
tara:strand:+ start:246 stop:653 length:408 start_codon:yes stop_codon:yes gene_type:complete